MSKKKKSQVWYIDFMVGILIFIMIIVIYYQYYGNLIDESDAEWQEMIIDSKSISSFLVSAGYPEDWTNDTVEILGLTDGNYRINSAKILQSMNMTYKQSRELLKTRFDFYFFLQSGNGTVFNAVGLNPTDTTFLVQTTRFVIYNSSIHRMVLYIWKA